MFYFLIFKLSIGTQLKITTDFNPFLVIIGDIYQTLLDRFDPTQEIQVTLLQVDQKYKYNFLRILFFNCSEMDPSFL